MATPVIMPRQGQSVESCIITKWSKKVGDHVAVGDILFSYETDKSSFDEEAKTEGELLAIFFEEGDDVECLLNVCVIGKAGESVAEFDPKKAKEAEAAPGQAEVQTEIKAEAPAATAAEPVSTEGRLKISPRAKALAEKQNADLRFAVPTGPNGRIIERDVRKLAAEGHVMTSAAKAEYLAGGMTVDGTGIGGRVSVADLTTPVQAATPAVSVSTDDFLACEEVKLPNIRKVIAKSMHASLSEMAQLTLNTSFDATNIMAFRAAVKENKDKMGFENITLNDIVLYAVAKTLPAHKDLNAHFCDDKIVYWKHVNLGVAVDTPRGLLVPTLFGAEQLSLNELSKQAKGLTEGAKQGTISPDMLKNGSFTVTNLGSLGVESFTPVINPPQTGILGVDNIRTQVKLVNGEPKYYQAMGLSLTFDHRAIDGAPAARFLQDLVKNLENFTLLLAK